MKSLVCRSSYLFSIAISLFCGSNVAAQSAIKFSYGAHANIQKHIVNFKSDNLIELTDWNQRSTMVGLDVGIQFKERIRLITGVSLKHHEYTVTQIFPNSDFGCQLGEISYLEESYNSDFAGIPLLIEYQLAKEATLYPNIIAGIISYASINEERRSSLVICDNEIFFENLFPETEQSFFLNAYVGFSLKAKMKDYFAISFEPNLNVHLNDIFTAPTNLFQQTQESTTSVYSYGLSLRLSFLR